MSRPIIGIVGRCHNHDGVNSIEVLEFYRIATISMGATPILILPPQNTEYYTQKVSELLPLTQEEKSMLDQELDLCDGILLPGGFKTFEFDRYIVEHCIKKDKPLLGVCLGMQIMANYGNIVENGMPDFISEKNNPEGIKHLQENKKYAHKVKILKESKLYSILRKEEIEVNSLHNYHVKKSPIYDIVAYSEDGLIEAVEYPKNKFNIGIQWHPERLMDDKIQNKLFKTFIKSCKE